MMTKGIQMYDDKQTLHARTKHYLTCYCMLHFDPTPGVVDKCTGKTLSNMLLHAALSNMNIF